MVSYRQKLTFFLTCYPVFRDRSLKEPAYDVVTDGGKRVISSVLAVCAVEGAAYKGLGRICQRRSKNFRYPFFADPNLSYLRSFSEVFSFRSRVVAAPKFPVRDADYHAREHRQLFAVPSHHDGQPSEIATVSWVRDARSPAGPRPTARCSSGMRNRQAWKII